MVGERNNVNQESWLQHKWVKWGLRAAVGAVVIASLETKPVLAQTEAEQYTTELVSKVNDRRELMGLSRFGIAPEGRRVEQFLGVYLTRLRAAWGRTGQVFGGGNILFPETAGNYMRQADPRIREQGEVIALPALPGEEDLWNPDEVANVWTLNFEGEDEDKPADILYAPTPANAIACAVDGGGAVNRAVLCATFWHPNPVPAQIVQSE